MVLSAFALTPIDSIAFEYQLSDLNFAARLALLRFVGFDFFSFCLSCSGVTGLTCTLVRTKPPLFAQQSTFLNNAVLPIKRIVRREATNIRSGPSVFRRRTKKTSTIGAWKTSALGESKTAVKSNEKTRKPSCLYVATEFCALVA